MKVGMMHMCMCVRVRVWSRNVTDDRSLQVAIGLMDKFFPRVIFIGTTEAGYPRLSTSAFQVGRGKEGEGRGNFFSGTSSVCRGWLELNWELRRPPIKFLHWSASVIRNRYLPTYVPRVTSCNNVDELTRSDYSNRMYV